MNNSSLLDDSYTSEANSLFTTIMYTLFGAFGIIGNAVVLLVIILVHDLHDATNVLIGNQSLIDLSTSVLIILGFVVPYPPLTPKLPGLSSFLCAFYYTKYLFWSTITASSLNLAFITLERYYAIVFPLRYQAQKSVNWLKVIVIIPWAAGLLFQQYLVYITRVEDDRCLQFLYTSDEMQQATGVLTVVIDVLIPISIMVYVYIAIALKLKRNIQDRFAEQCPQRKDNGDIFTAPSPMVQQTVIDQRSRASRNTIKMLLMLSICFVVCWMPSQALYLYFSFGGYLDFKGIPYMVSVFISFGNIWINPFIYTFQYQRFQRGLRKVFCKEKRSNKKPRRAKNLAIINP